jgi:hypothetical protein
MNNRRYVRDSQIDTINKKIKLTEYKDSTKIYILDYNKTDYSLRISGVFRKYTIIRERQRLDKKDFRFTSRSSNWINECLYNR